MSIINVTGIDIRKLTDEELGEIENYLEKQIFEWPDECITDAIDGKPRAVIRISQCTADLLRPISIRVERNGRITEGNGVLDGLTEVYNAESGNKIEQFAHLIAPHLLQAAMLTMVMEELEDRECRKALGW